MYSIQSTFPYLGSDDSFKVKHLFLYNNVQLYFSYYIFFMKQSFEISLKCNALPNSASVTYFTWSMLGFRWNFLLFQSGKMSPFSKNVFTTSFSIMLIQCMISAYLQYSGVYNYIHFFTSKRTTMVAKWLASEI